MSAAFFVPGTPRAQPRPSIGRGRAYYDDNGRSDAWKSCVRMYGTRHRPKAPSALPLRVVITFWLPRPKRLLGPRAPQGAVWAPQKPDVDNMSKAVYDALGEDGWYLDDKQIVASVAEKRYAPIGEEPGAWINVTEVGPT